MEQSEAKLVKKRTLPNKVERPLKLDPSSYFRSDDDIFQESF